MANRDAKYMLCGIVEVDDTYFGGPKSGGPWNKNQSRCGGIQR